MNRKRSSTSNRKHNSPEPSAVRFPADRSLGNLYMLDSADDTQFYWISWMNRWTHIGKARGEVLLLSEGLLGFQPAPDFSDADMAHLAKMPRMFRLAFGTGILEMASRNTVTDDGFAHLSVLSELDSLTIDVSGISYDGLRPLQTLSKLRHADFGVGLGPLGSGMTDRKMAHVAYLESLQTLCLDGTDVTDRSLVYVESLRELTTLSLFETKVRGDGLVHLHALRNLEELSLGGPEITDKELAYLQPLKSLRILRLHGVTIKSHGLMSLESMTELKTLDLRRAEITDRQLDDLPTLPSLTNILMPWTDITDDGLLSLRRFPNLQYLYLKGTELSEYAVEEMRRYFPDITIQGRP